MRRSDRRSRFGASSTRTSRRAAGDAADGCATTGCARSAPLRPAVDPWPLRVNHRWRHRRASFARWRR